MAICWWPCVGGRVSSRVRGDGRATRPSKTAERKPPRFKTLGECTEYLRDPANESAIGVTLTECVPFAREAEDYC